MTKNSQELFASIKEMREEESTGDLIIEGFANTTSKDRVGDVIPSSTWEKPGALKNYLKNPIILAYHDHTKPIGSMVEHAIEPMGLRIKARISKGAGDTYTLIKDGVLKTFSVGMMVKDANYDSDTDTFYITDVELTEVSVVSVPCNQDSVFNLSKGLKDSLKKKHFSKEEGNTNMNEQEMQALIEKLMAANPAVTTADINAAVAKAIADAKEAEKAEIAQKAKEEAARIAAEQAVKSSAREEAQALVKELKDSMADSEKSFQEKVAAQEELIKNLKDEIAQVVSGRDTVAAAVSKGIVGSDKDATVAKQADELIMLSAVKNIKIEQTKHFESVKAVNASSSIQVSSDAYETIFSTNLIRDIQAALVVAPLFSEMMLDAAQITIPINPNRQNANWVAAAAMADGSDPARTGGEITVALTERTLKTYKLAAKSYLTEETEEDTIISLVPILRQHLVEAHAAEMDRAFLVGTGVGMPEGLVTKATSAGAVLTGAAKADGSVRVTALELASARRLLDLYGINTSELVFVISQDAYWDLILDPEWADVQQVTAANATKLNGEVGNVYGIRVLVSNHFDAKAVSTAYGVLVNAKNFVVPRQRGVTLRSDFDVELDRRVFVATQRVNLEDLIVGKGVAALTYAAA